MSGERFEPCGNIRLPRQLFIREVEVRFAFGPERVEFVVGRFEPAGKDAVELFFGNSERQVAPGGNHVVDRFCLSEVELAVHEGAEGEFPRLRKTAARREDAPQRLVGRRLAAVAVEFDHVVAGVAGRARHENGEGGVDADPAEQQFAPAFGPELAPAAPDPAADGQRIRARDADDRNGPPDSGGRSRDVVECVHMKTI